MTADVWRIPLDVSDAALDRCRELLSAEERERAARFRFARDSRRFIVARGSLRSVLAGYMDRPARDLAFEVSAYGKPTLRGAGDLHFNLSHSQDRAVCAVGPQELGVDIECVRPVSDLMELALRFFHPREVAQLREYGSREQAAAFYRCWTRKEAYIKARGLGLSIALDRFAVSLDAERPSLLEAEHGVAPWSVANFNAGPGYLGALAASAVPLRVQEREFETVAVS